MYANPLMPALLEAYMSACQAYAMHVVNTAQGLPRLSNIRTSLLGSPEFSAMPLLLNFCVKVLFVVALPTLPTIRTLSPNQHLGVGHHI